MTYEELLAEHVAAGFEKQALLSDLIGDRPWAADLDEGSISFGDDIAASTEVLGSEDDRVGTWLWAWANEGWGLAPGLMEAAHRAQELGGELDVPELIEGSFPLDDLRNGDGVALVCLGLLDLPAYYSGPAGDGRVLFVVHHPDLVLPAPEALRASTVLTQSVSTFDLDHPTVVWGYARHRDIPMDAGDDFMELRFPDGRVLEVTFDDQLRISEIQIV